MQTLCITDHFHDFVTNLNSVRIQGTKRSQTFEANSRIDTRLTTLDWTHFNKALLVLCFDQYLTSFWQSIYPVKTNFELYLRIALKHSPSCNRLSGWDQDNSPQRQLAPRQLAPKKTRPKTTRLTFRRQLAPHSEDNSPHLEGNSPQVVLTCYNLKIKKSVKRTH